MGYICIKYTLYIKIQTSKLLLQVHLILSPTAKLFGVYFPPLANQLTIMLFHFNDFLLFLPFSPAFANIFLTSSSLSWSTRACGKFGLSASVKVTSASTHWLDQFLSSCRPLESLSSCHDRYRSLPWYLPGTFLCSCDCLYVNDGLCSLFVPL